MEKQGPGLSSKVKDLKRVECGARTMELDTVDDLMTNWARREGKVELQTQIIRCLRAALAYNPRGEVRSYFVQRHVKTALDLTDKILRDTGGDPWLMRARVCMQFMVNASADSSDFRDAFLAHTAKDAAFNLLIHKDAKLRRIAAILAKLYLDRSATSFTLDSTMLSRMLLTLTGDESQGSPECLSAILMALKKHINAVAELFDGLTGPEKRALLDVLHEWPEDETIGLDAVSLVSKLFKEQSTTLLTTFKAGESADPALTMKLLELICEWTANEDDHQKQIQDDTSVLIDAVYMLKMVHQLGTEGKEKEYEPVRKISQLDCAFILTNPVFGFKRDLVRLIGNLCWRHKKNQETVRDIDGIPLLLDCSPIDANNPFMLQWVVFAMRNLCEDNADNQKVLEGIDKEGTMTAEMAKAAEVTIKRSHKKKIAQPEQTAEDEKMQEGEEVDAGKTADAVNSGGAEGDNNSTAGTPAS